MLNNKLNASYMKDVIRFMEMYHLRMLGIFVQIEGKDYASLELSCAGGKYELTCQDMDGVVPPECVIELCDKKTFVEKFKQCRYYMYDVRKW